MTRSRFRTFDFWDGFVFGLAVCATILISFAWIASDKSYDAQSAFATLATIPAALFAAAAAFWLTRYQLNYTRSQDLVAAKAVLPLALTQLIEVSENAIRIISGQYSNPRIDLDGARKLLTLPDGVVSVLRDNIKSADPVSQAWMSVLVANYQVYFARINGWWDSPFPKVDRFAILSLDHHRQQALLDWATLHALTAHLFEYARNNLHSVPTVLDTNLINAAFFHAVFEVEFDDDFNKWREMRLERIKDGRIEHFMLRR